MKAETKAIIEIMLQNQVDKTLKRLRTSNDHKPFHEALLTKEFVDVSSFERSFSTSFGQGSIEKISKILAKANGFEVESQKETMAIVYKGASDKIELILENLRDGSTTPKWDQEVKMVTAFNKGNTQVKRVISDLWLSKDGVEHFISIKTVKPNLDQTEKVKRDMLTLLAHNKSYKVYLGLYYNPGGEKKEDYNWAMPSKIFDMKKDPCVLIGREYWDTIGGSGTYEALIEIFQKVGEDTKARIEEGF